MGLLSRLKAASGVCRIRVSDVFPQGKICAAGFHFVKACGFQTAFGSFGCLKAAALALVGFKNPTHTHFDGKAQVAEQIKGIGSITTATLMAMLPELGRLSHKRLASLVGIAPHPRESGETKFKSRCFGGRSEVRKALYMATVVATRFEPRIRDFYQRLLSKGKPYKVAVTACMHKLLRILNARMRDYLASLQTKSERQSEQQSEQQPAPQCA